MIDRADFDRLLELYPVLRDLPGELPRRVGAEGQRIAARAEWDFGDGSTSTLTSPMHVYTSAGTFTARLTVTDNGGLSSSTTLTVNVTAPTPVIRTTGIALSAKRHGSDVNVTGRVFVRDASGAAVPGAIVSIQWSLPDFTRQARSAATDASGVATFTASGGRGTYTLSVTGVVKTGFAYSGWDSVTSAQISK